MMPAYYFNTKGATLALGILIVRLVSDTKHNYHVVLESFAPEVVVGMLKTFRGARQKNVEAQFVISTVAPSMHRSGAPPND